MQDNIKETLIDVRKAFRLLFDFQSRILDLVAFIGGTFNFSYVGGFTKFSNNTKDGRGNLKDWGWDWMPMYFYGFQFDTKKEMEDEIRFAVFLMADSGYFESEMENKAKTDLSTFKSVENSTTKMVFVVGKNMWEDSKLRSDNWNNEIFTTHKQNVEKDGEKVMLFKSYDLLDFVDEESALQGLRDFAKFANDNEVNIKVQERRI